MLIRVKYNSDQKFRRRAAFNNFYRAPSPRTRFLIEVGILAALVVICIIIWNSQTANLLINYSFYGCAIASIYLLGRLLRIYAGMRRLNPLRSFEVNREYHFFENGFRFGPTDEIGTMLETRWREVHHAYHIGNVIYLLCKDKTQWAPIDLDNVVEGSADDLTDLIHHNVPGKRYTRAER